MVLFRPAFRLSLHAHSLDTSLPKRFAFVQSSNTRSRLRVLKHMLRYALFQKRYVIVPPLARLPANQLTSATALSAPIYASEPWCEYLKGPICFIRLSCFCRSSIRSKIALRSSDFALACFFESSANSCSIVSVLAMVLKSRARKAPSCAAT